MIEGEANSLELTFEASVENAAFVPEFASELMVRHPLTPPLPPKEVVQPAGKAGTTAVSKFSENTAPDCPSNSWTVLVPRFTDPSCNCRVAVTVPPQVPAAVNVYG